MPSLSSLIVQRQVATIEEVEQAIARQVLHGGDLVTNLLEVAPQVEHALTRVLGESLGLPSVHPGRLPAPDTASLETISADAALRNAVFPLRISGRTLVVATPELLQPSVEHDLAFSAGLDITQVAAPAIRIREGIAAHYGVPLDPRQLRLVRRLDKHEQSAVPNEVPPLPATPSILPSHLSSGVSEPPPPVSPHGAAAFTNRRVSTLDMKPRARGSTQPLPVPERAFAGAAGDPPEGNVSDTEPPGPNTPSMEDAPDSTPPTVSQPLPAYVDTPEPARALDRKAALGLLRREAGQGKQERKTARRKGPFSRADAERELEKAESPEAVLDAFFAFGSQFFEQSALFVVHGDLASGRDAFGPAVDLARVQGLGVPLDLPSSLQAARTSGHVVLTRLDEHDLDRELRADLGRAATKSALVALIPLTLRGRAVAMLYGDDGAADVSLPGLGDLLAWSALASSHVERLALLKKSKKGKFAGIVAPKSAPSPRAPAGTVAALARALDLPAGAPPAAAPAPAPRQAPSRLAALANVGISAGAASVLPPPMPKVETTNPYDEHLLEPGPPSPATPMLTESRGESRDVPPLTQQSQAQASSADSPNEPSEFEPAAAASREPPRVDAYAPTALGAAHLDELSAPPTSARQSRPHPIPRVDEEDASAFVAGHGVSDWGDPSPEPPALAASSGRVGAYQYVQRPADSQRGTTIDDLLMRARAGGIDGEEAMNELLREAEHSFATIVERFPGPLKVDRFKLREDLPQASDSGPLLKLLVTMRRMALPFMTVRSTSHDVDHRFWATHVLGELHFPEASNAVVPRLFDEDVAVRRVARRAAQALVTAGPAGEPLRASLEHTVRNEEEGLERRLLMIEALAEIRLPAVVPILIGVLGDSSDAVVDAARTALITVTRQEFGRSADVWTAWWERRKNEHRVLWLIHALTHDNPNIRRAAGDELKRITREYFGYYDDLPARERERAQAAYLTWWEEEGQYRFR